MLNLIKPPHLQKGDKVACVSLSWGGAGDPDILWRYHQGKERLIQHFGFEVVEMPHTLMGSAYIYEHPEKRAEDLMAAFADPTIKGIIACIGGIESIRMLPYIDLNVIRDNPKIFLGYSDTTTTHLMCFKAGLSSIYGPTLLVDFAENGEMHPYTVSSLEKALMVSAPIGDIPAATEWTSDYLPWDESRKNETRKMTPNNGYELLQGEGIVQGPLLGGCLEVFDSLRGTILFPTLDQFDRGILFLETSEDKPPVWFIECALRNYGVSGILAKLNGIIWGKPQDETYYTEYKEVIQKVLAEFHLSKLPVLYNVNFGHTEPKICLPYGAIAEINCDQVTLAILESGTAAL